MNILRSGMDKKNRGNFSISIKNQKKSKVSIFFKFQLLREALFPSGSEEKLMSVLRACVRPKNN